MSPSRRVRVGAVPFLNCVPFLHTLAEHPDAWEVIWGPPTELNRRLAAGELDVSISSSFEYAQRPEAYFVHPHLGIGCTGAIRSIALFTRMPLEEFRGEPIAVTTASASARAQLQVLTHTYLNVKATFRNLPEDPALWEQEAAVLLIGDDALRARSRPKAAWAHAYDLGELWHRETELPFVYALWIVRAEVVESHRAELEHFFGAISEALDAFPPAAPKLAAKSAARLEMPQEGIELYWKTVEYRLNAAHFRGLERFFTDIAAVGLVPAPATLRFLPFFD